MNKRTSTKRFRIRATKEFLDTLTWIPECTMGVTNQRYHVVSSRLYVTEDGKFYRLYSNAECKLEGKRKQNFNRNSPSTATMKIKQLGLEQIKGHRHLFLSNSKNKCMFYASILVACAFSKGAYTYSDFYIPTPSNIRPKIPVRSNRSTLKLHYKDGNTKNIALNNLKITYRNKVDA
jgi:hypothetical protein